MLAIIAGFFGFGLLFSDYTSWLVRSLELLVHFFVPGLVVGLFFPRGWALSGLVGWGGVVLMISGLAFSWTARDLPVLEITVTDGTMALAPEIIHPGDLRIRQRNLGPNVHEIAIAAGVSGAHDLPFTLRPLAPGESDESVFSGVFGTGRYFFYCLRHPDGAEVAELRVAPREGGAP
ncbi:hypothetical protein BH18GEM1_BH18GEM1_04070 [soil metagenome]